ncbi:MAG: DoxX family protein [Actinomycetota bacterium]|nr:DoxX family protein [Actinomycetota bacterium]
MFLFTGTSHFTSMKYDFAAMIPDPLPDGLWVIYLTGVFEIAGAIGLLIPQTRKLAGICLVLLLVAMFSANVNAALNAIPLGGQDPTPLWLRTPMQLLYIGMVWWTSIKAPAKEDGGLRRREPGLEQDQTPSRQGASS